MEIPKDLEVRVRNSISSITPSELHSLFDILRLTNYSKLTSAKTDEERLTIQIRTRVFDELELSLKSLRNSA